MGNVDQVFSSFYGGYSFNSIRRAYGTIAQQTFFSDIYKIIPFKVELRMKNGVFAMRIKAESIVSMELMTVIGFFFENYSKERNCVWTKREENIKKFFNHGVEQFISFGGEIALNISDDDKLCLVDLLTDGTADERSKKKLCDNFSMLERENWPEYEEYVASLVKSEEEARHIEEVTCMELPMDWNNAFATDERAAGLHADSAADALVLSLNDLGRVDIEYISQITGLDYKDVISSLHGAIYQNPDSWDECFYKGWETADEYLSGRILDKLNRAREANKKYKGYFRENVKALEKAVPKKVSTDDIYVTLGSPWVPTDVIDDFIEHLLGNSLRIPVHEREKFTVKHDESTGLWEIPFKTRYGGSVKSKDVYGTKRIDALHIIERTLNMKAVAITDEVQSLTNKSGKRRVINKTETVLALEKQKNIIEEFQSWVWKDNKRKKRLQEIYDEKYCSSVIRRYDGSFLTFPHMAESEKLYDYQKNAVARIMFSPNTLLAHDVGAGKTYVMISAGMEMRRIGISKKNLYVVPNTLVGQWKEIFLKLYPDANLLCVEPNGFKKGKREKVLKSIRDEDYDGIIMAYSSFELIPVSKEYYMAKIEEEIEEINRKAQDENKVTSSHTRKKEKLKKALKELEEAIMIDYDSIYFEELGINTMFVDEAHNYKNVPIETQITKVLGISTAGSSKCSDMMDKVRIVQKNNNGRGIVFATGTPITNSLTDIFVMQKYLQGGELALLDLQSFDSWVGMFAEKSSEFEVDVDTSNFRMATRFTKFHNMPELSTLLAAVTDFHQVDKTNGIPQTDGYSDVIVSKTSDFKAYLEDISRRADDVRQGRVSRTDDNMLKITTDGRKAALDLRLVDNTATFTYQSKVVHCAENVFDIYIKTRDKKSTQLIFCDTSTPKAGFNLYDELKGLLSAMGILKDEIAFIHDAETERERNALFAKVRSGEVRVLIGSTFKLGLGVNVQNKLIAIHHLDVPWRPADMTQREGRILRKGNENSVVQIFRYITEGSFDAYSWQLLESKAKVISAILSGSMPDRMCAEIDDTVLGYAEVKAVAIGNPLLKKRVETANELSRHYTLQRRFVETRQALEVELVALPGRISYQKNVIAECKEDIALYKEKKRKYDEEERRELRKLLHYELSENELSENERTVFCYQGFDVILPTGMLRSMPFVYLKGSGKYKVEMGLAETGVLVRIDNFLEDLGKLREKEKVALAALSQREADIKAELDKEGGYSETIESLKSELDAIDKKLGVKI